MNDKLVKTQSLYPLIDYEPLIILTILILVAWIFYRVFLKEVSAERHFSLRKHFRILTRHFLILIAFFAIFKVTLNAEFGIDRTLPYLGVLVFFWGGMVFIRTCRLVILMYLFLGSMRAGVPILVVNIFSLALSLIIFFWGLAAIFGIELRGLLVTSAALSVVLGLALQDTLGNLFAGISIQLDKSFEIGDWLEVISSDHEKTVGQVKEINWRATTLIGWTDEVIVIPNRVLAAAKISNFQSGDQPIIRSQIFRLGYETDIEKARQCLLAALTDVRGVRKIPSPLCIVTEHTESWVGLKLIYYIDNFGEQYFIGHDVISKGLEILRNNGIQTTNTTLKVLTTASGAAPRPFST